MARHRCSSKRAAARVAGLAVVLSSAPAFAGAIISHAGRLSGPSPVGIVTLTSGQHVVSQNGPNGEWLRSGSAFNSNNVPSAIIDPGPYVGPYAPPSGGGLGSPLDSGVVAYPGGDMRPEARAVMAYAPMTWNTRESYASVLPLGPSPVGIVDATAEAHDPASYTVTFDLQFKPEVRLSTTLEAGLGLIATTVAPGQISSSQIFGSFVSDLVIDETLWTFDWSADSKNPGASSFFFTSNPLLGLDDVAITNLFLSKVSSFGGTHVLTDDFTIEVVVPVFVSDNPTVSYSFGSDVHYNAHATPEPTVLGLLVLGVGLGRRRLVGR
jgi:hypothetical protein